ncbi:MAG TPA: MotA/TolQ/ExbB proton channel family protein, partial [Candidatus Latescibacteria bacterium]|nr:MotA/TolQ/ExbB proton channel family protein [Candidatus Latescibacterota bacterium]
ASFLQRGMIVIASVTVIAPFFGFLGTVWGMVIAFKAIAEAGDVNPTIVASGISQALITTVGGLIIAIISQSLYNFLLSRINRIVIDMEETSTKLVDLLIEEGMDKPASS